jgi:hypothetical protein
LEGLDVIRIQCHQNKNKCIERHNVADETGNGITPQYFFQAIEECHLSGKEFPSQRALVKVGELLVPDALLKMPFLHAGESG